MARRLTELLRRPTRTFKALAHGSRTRATSQPTSGDMFQTPVIHYFHLDLRVFQLEWGFFGLFLADFAEKLAVKPSFHSLRNKTLRCIPGLNGSIHIQNLKGLLKKRNLDFDSINRHI